MRAIKIQRYKYANEKVSSKRLFALISVSDRTEKARDPYVLIARPVGDVCARIREPRLTLI